MGSLGDVLLTARRAAGLTQAELSGTVEVTQAALSRYEQDLRVPDDETLERLADALGVTRRFLQRAQSPNGAMAVDAHMRRRKTAKPTTWRQLEAKLNMLRLHIQQMSEIVDISASLTLPSVDPVMVDPAEAARLVRMQWRLPVGPVRALTQWMEAAGCVMVAQDFDTDRIDGLSQWVAGIPVVLMNTTAPPDRLRLTLAHELGHLVMHREEVVENLEEQANAFAAEFLMPEAVIRSELHDLTLAKAASLKRVWWVSMQALIERAYQLGTLPAAKRTSLYKQLSARGMRVREPYGEFIPREQPALTAAIATQLLRQGLGADEIAEMLGYRDATHNELLPTPRLRAV